MSLWQTKLKEVVLHRDKRSFCFLQFPVTLGGSNMPRVCWWKPKRTFANLSHRDLRTSLRYFYVWTYVMQTTLWMKINDMGHMEWRIREAPRLHMFPVGCNKNWNTLCNATNGANKLTSLMTQAYSQFLWHVVFHCLSSTNRYKITNPEIPHYVFMDTLWSIRSKTELHVPYRFLTATHSDMLRVPLLKKKTHFYTWNRPTRWQ